MICRFCSQWNSAQAPRCCFCGNTQNATDDATAGSGVSASYQGLAQLPDHQSPPANKIAPTVSDPQLSRHGRELARAKLTWSIIIAIGVGIWLLYQFKVHC